MKKLTYIVPIVVTIMLYISCGGKETVTPNCTECPTITSVSPSIGFAGDSVKIVGTKFKGLKAVYFGEKEVTNFNLSPSGDTITVEVPQAETGKEKDSVTVSIAIVNPNQPSISLNSNVKGSFKYAEIMVEDFVAIEASTKPITIDNQGNIYYISGKKIKKVDKNTKLTLDLLVGLSNWDIFNIAYNSNINKLYFNYQETVGASYSNKVGEIDFNTNPIKVTNTIYTLSPNSEYIGGIVSVFDNNNNLYIETIFGSGKVDLTVLKSNTISSKLSMPGGLALHFAVINNSLVHLNTACCGSPFIVSLFRDFTKPGAKEEIFNGTSPLTTKRSFSIYTFNNKLFFINNDALYIKNNLFNTQNNQIYKSKIIGNLGDYNSIAGIADKEIYVATSTNKLLKITFQ